jgi:hypothetical protein
MMVTSSGKLGGFLGKGLHLTLAGQTGDQVASVKGLLHTAGKGKGGHVLGEEKARALTHDPVEKGLGRLAGWQQHGGVGKQVCDHAHRLCPFPGHGMDTGAHHAGGRRRCAGGTGVGKGWDRAKKDAHGPSYILGADGEVGWHGGGRTRHRCTRERQGAHAAKDLGRGDHPRVS